MPLTKHPAPNDHTKKALDAVDEPVLMPAQADYLAIIYEEFIKTGQARGCSIAQKAGVSRATVAATMRSLKALGLIDYYPYSPIELTEKGLRIGSRLFSSRAALEKFFLDVLGLPEGAARAAARAHQRASMRSAVLLEALVAFVANHRDEWDQMRSQALQRVQAEDSPGLRTARKHTEDPASRTQPHTDTPPQTP